MTSATKLRLQAFRELLAQTELDALLVLGPENRWYLSGFPAKDPDWGMLLLTPKTAVLLTDFRYETWARQEAPDFEVVVYKESLGVTLSELLGQRAIRRLGFEAAYLTYRQYQRLTQAVAEAGLQIDWLPQEGMVEGLREVKSEEELAAIRRALDLTESVLGQIGAQLTPGLTERQVAWDIEKRLREAGADAPAFPPIVAAGLNSARPHHQPGEYRLKQGEPIIIDLGAKVAGYCADLTRTYVLGAPDEKFRQIYTLVRQAQKSAEAGLKAGLDSLAADALGREVIAAAGLGEAFGHSLGHGVGLAVHEAPRLSPSKELITILQAGSVITVEPGIYLPDWGGVRLEDLVLLHPHRAEVLNRLGFYEW